MSDVTAKRIPAALPDMIQITMTEDEASSLVEVLFHVGGPISGRRTHIDSIRKALIAIGIERKGQIDRKLGAVYFEEVTL